MYSSYFFSANQMDFIYTFIYFDVQDKTGFHNKKNNINIKNDQT